MRDDHRKRGLGHRGVLEIASASGRAVNPCPPVPVQTTYGHQPSAQHARFGGEGARRLTERSRTSLTTTMVVSSVTMTIRVIVCDAKININYNINCDR